MSKEILTLVDALASEKNVDREIVFSALEFALATAAKKRFEQDHIEVRTEINRESGEYQNYRRWLIVKDEDYTYPDTEMTEEEIEEKFPGMHLDAGEYYEEKIENVEFGRIGAQTAKQVILQRIRDAERDQLLQDFLARGDKIMMGTVKRVDKVQAIVESGRVEAILPRDQMLPRENLRSGDRVRAYVAEVDQTARGARQLHLSRTCPEFLIELFTQEVPEIEQGGLQIKGAARDPGVRAKVAVHAVDQRIDPWGIFTVSLAQFRGTSN
mgnify:CR=1 FL=1